MARIVGAIASSHTPTIGFAYDKNKRSDPDEVIRQLHERHRKRQASIESATLNL